jgi:hypothetical protein
MKICKINLMQFNQTAALDFHRDIADIIAGEWGERERPAALLAYYQAIKDFRAVIGDLAEEEDLFAAMHEYDLKVDNAWRGLKASILVACYHPNEDIRNAGEMVDSILSAYDNPVNLPLVTEHHIISEVLSELEELDPAVLDMAGVSFWLNEVSSNFDRLMEIYAQRLQGLFDEVAGKARDARLLLHRAYNDFITYLAALCLVEGEEEYSDLIRALNEYIMNKRSEYKAKILI